MKITVATILAVLLFNASYLFPYWEWTPQTGRWINPKYAVMDTAESQFSKARDLHQEGQQREAIREYLKVVEHFPASEYAYKSLYELGNIHKSRGDDRKAFQYYQQIIDDYPQSPLFFDVLEKQSDIALRSLDRRSFGFRGSVASARGEKFSQVIDNYPYSEEAAEMAFDLASFYFSEGEYREASRLFSHLIDEYPGSRFADRSLYYLLESDLRSVPPVSTDTKKLQEIRRRAERFIMNNPGSGTIDEFRSLRERVVVREAEAYYAIASYYRRAGKNSAADYYFRLIMDNYGDTEYGKLAAREVAGDN